MESTAARLAPRTLRRLLAAVGPLFAALALSGCGDVPHVAVSISFPDDTTKAATRRLLFIVREEPKDGNGCNALWSTEPTALAESRSYVDYPYRNDVVAAPVKLSQYPSLSLLIYALPSRDVGARPIAGGCADVVVDASGAVESAIALIKPPS